jgi:hypothetical protein
MAKIDAIFTQAVLSEEDKYEGKYLDDNIASGTYPSNQMHQNRSFTLS